ncbi:MAG: hypothetical protein CSA79_00600 [Thiothrix nivea]|nr:MAG: hypothetical protein CSA79_00600 [Thiothrix nivea]
MLNSPNNPLKVALLSISPHNRAILEFFFAGAGKQIFKPVTLEEADALIVDFDHPGAQQEWQDRISQVPTPAIVLSVKESDTGNTVWVPKPLTSQALVRSAEQIRKMLPDTTETEYAEVTAGKQKFANDMSPLRALLDSQREDKQVFGLSGEYKRSNAGRPTYQGAESLVKENRSFVTRAEPDSVIAADTVKADEQLIATEDVFIPEPLSDEEIILKTEGEGISLGQVTTPDESTPDKEQQERRWAMLCGEAEERLTARNWQESAQLYTPENYLLNSLVDALKLSRESKQYVQVVLEENGAFILLMPDVNLAYSSIDLYSDAFTHLCDKPLQGGRAKLHLPDTGTLSELEEIVRQDASHTYDMEGLIWTVSLLTSHGRLSRNAEMSSFRLRSWPNLTRLEQFPHVMPIAALWSQQPGNVFDMSEWLNVPQRYVLAFFNAAHTLGLFEVDHGKAGHEQKAAPKKNRGLFSRLLKRLLGGGSK